MNKSVIDEYNFKVCNAVLSRDRVEAPKLISSTHFQNLPVDIRLELEALISNQRPSRVGALIHLTYALPAWMQFIGQRLVLVSPKFASLILRKTGLHQRWF